MAAGSPASGRSQQVPRPYIVLGTLIIAAVFILILLSARGCACITIYADAAQAVRTGPDTIRITMQTDRSHLIFHTPLLTIQADDRDVTNQSVIAAAGIPLAISPRGGLLFRNGSAVTLAGRAARGNATAPVHIVVTVYYPDTGYLQVIADQYA